MCFLTRYCRFGEAKTCENHRRPCRTEEESIEKTRTCKLMVAQLDACLGNGGGTGCVDVPGRSVVAML